MSAKNTLSLVLYANTPFIRETDRPLGFQEAPFFEALNDTFMPLLAMFERLEAARIPFRLALVLPPVFCHLVQDEILIERYLRYSDMRISFGECEIERLKDKPSERALAEHYRREEENKRLLFTGRYRKNILEAFLVYKQRGQLELLSTAATNAFLPFYLSTPSVINAQIETALYTSWKHLNGAGAGFWLPELGYCESLDAILKKYRFTWTIVDTHTALLAAPSPEAGSFYPFVSPAGLLFFSRDFFAYEEIMHTYPLDTSFRSYFDDVGFELPAADIHSFLPADGIRIATGYKYHTVGKGASAKNIYNVEEAAAAAKTKARSFFENRKNALAAASGLSGKPAISLCAYNADFLGRFWYEGITFMEELFCLGANSAEVTFMTPSEYLAQQNPAQFQTVVPEFSSQGFNGYAESYLDASNDWIYRHLLQAGERMVEVAERFEEEKNSLRERLLNQAAREILLAQNADWARILSMGEHHISRPWSTFARNQIETSLRNFTTFYEALGSNQISTRFLTQLEKKDAIFPDINYRVFRRKRKGISP